MCAGRHVSGSVSCFVPNIVLFPECHFIALEPRPLLTCSVFPFPTVICSAATQVSLGISTVGSITLGRQQMVWKLYPLQTHCVLVKADEQFPEASFA